MFTGFGGMCFNAFSLLSKVIIVTGITFMVAKMLFVQRIRERAYAKQVS
jgi:hypothetical protein